MTSRRTAGSAGFTLIELLIAMVVLSVVMGATVSVFRAQTQTFSRSGERLEVYQNMRYAVNVVDRVLRTAGAGVTNQQPMFVYGDGNTVALNTNYTHDVQDNCAVNINPDAPVGSFGMLPLASAYILPNTAFSYPAVNYPAGTCSAETYVFFFRPDSTTADAGDFMLLQRVNATPPELVARNVFPYPARPFFEYFVHPQTLAVPPATRDSLVQANVAGSGVPLPIRHIIPIHGAPADSARDPSNSYLADSVKAVRINVRVSNGLTGAEQRFRDISTVTSLPNNGLVQLKTCGTTPLLTGNLTAAPNLPGEQPSVTLAWAPSIDEAAGEGDVTQYNVYRRRQIDPAFGSAVLIIPAGQPPPYQVQDLDVEVNVPYVYTVTAQDCTPRESAALVMVPNPVTPVP